MCRILIRWKEKPQHIADENKRERAFARRGDAIEVMEDGREWGRCQQLKDGVVSLDLDGVPAKAMRWLLDSEPSPLLTAYGKEQVMRKRAFRIAVDELPGPVLDILNKDGKASVSVAELAGRVIHKETGLRR